MIQGYVYVIEDTESHLYKIGRSANPVRRLRELNRQGTLVPGVVNRQRFRLTHVIACRDERAVEKQLHERFAKRRRVGEFFALGPQELEALQAIRIA